MDPQKFEKFTQEACKYFDRNHIIKRYIPNIFKSGNMSLFKYFLDKKYLTEIDPIHFYLACEYGHTELVKELVKYDPNHDWHDQVVYTDLTSDELFYFLLKEYPRSKIYAISHYSTNLEKVKYLLDNFTFTNNDLYYSYTGPANEMDKFLYQCQQFKKACRLNKIQNVKSLYINLSSIDLYDGFKTAIIYENIDVVKFLVDKITNKTGLYTACSYGNEEIVDLLLESGFTDFNDGLVGACGCEHQKIAIKMIKAGATNLDIISKYDIVYDILEEMYTGELQKFMTNNYD